MKNLLLAGLSLASLYFATTACSDQKKAGQTTATATTATAPAASSDSTATPTGAGTDAAPAAYSCPMHPQVASDKPGKCPECGMALVKK